MFCDRMRSVLYERVSCSQYNVIIIHVQYSVVLYIIHKLTNEIIHSTYVVNYLMEIYNQ